LQRCEPLAHCPWRRKRPSYPLAGTSGFGRRSSAQSPRALAVHCSTTVPLQRVVPVVQVTGGVESQKPKPGTSLKIGPAHAIPPVQSAALKQKSLAEPDVLIDVARRDAHEPVAAGQRRAGVGRVRIAVGIQTGARRRETAVGGGRPRVARGAVRTATARDVAGGCTEPEIGHVEKMSAHFLPLWQSPSTWHSS